MRKLVALTIYMMLGASPRAQAQDTTTVRSFADVQDTVANPIRMGCGERVDPVGYVLFMADDLGLTAEQVTELHRLDVATSARTRPIAQRWRSDHEGLLELREEYRSALNEIERILTAPQLDEALRPRSGSDPSSDQGRSRGMVRCLWRSHLAIIR